MLLASPTPRTRPPDDIIFAPLRCSPHILRSPHRATRPVESMEQQTTESGGGRWMSNASMDELQV